MLTRVVSPIALQHIVIPVNSILCSLYLCFVALQANGNLLVCRHHSCSRHRCIKCRFQHQQQRWLWLWQLSMLELASCMVKCPSTHRHSGRPDQTSKKKAAFGLKLLERKLYHLGPVVNYMYTEVACVCARCCMTLKSTCDLGRTNHVSPYDT